MESPDIPDIEDILDIDADLNTVGFTTCRLLLSLLSLVFWLSLSSSILLFIFLRLFQQKLNFLNLA